jgi:flagellar hook-length control protein FliK
MASMDIGIPDLSTGRDTAPDATRRRGKSDPSDFSALLDRAVDEQDAQPRDRASDKSSATSAADKPREKVQRTDRADNDGARRTEDDQPTQAAEDSATAQNPAQQVQQTQAQNQPQHTGEAPQAPVQAGDGQPATNAAADEKVSDEAGALAQQPPTAAPWNSAANADPTQASDDMPPAAIPPMDVEASPAPTGASDKAAKTTPEQSAKAAAPAASPATPFAEQLASSVAAPPEPTAKNKPKTETAAATDAPTEQPAAVAPAVVVEPALSVVAPNQQIDPAQASTEQQAAASAPAALTPPAQAAAQAPATPTPAAASTPAGETESADDSSLIAMLRAAGAQGQSAPRAESEPDDAPTPDDDFLKAVQIDAKPAADAQKPEPPARPFGALAPGLGLAAQITAQQAPEQANAAERLTQLVSAVEDEATDPLAKPADEAKPADTAASPRAEPQPQVDAAAQRQAAIDVSPASAAARTARPATHPVVTQVAAQVAQAAADGTDRINIRLSPAELGRIDVKLDFGPDGRVQAVFAAERPQTMELLQRDARDLERALQDAGLRADSGSLSFNLRGQGRDAQNGQTSHGGRQDSVPPDIAASQLQVYSAGLAGSGRLDIRI